MRTDLEELYKENGRALMAVAMHYVHDKDAAEDIVHDSWILIFTNLDNLRSEDKLLPWMKGIVRNLSLKYLDNQKRHPSTGISEKHEIIDEDDSDSVLPLIPLDELMTMIDSLPEKYGEVFRLSVLNGMSHQEIGDLLGIAAHSSSSDLSRAKKILVQKVRKYLLMTLALFLPVSIFILRNIGDRADESTVAQVEEEVALNMPDDSNETFAVQKDETGSSGLTPAKKPSLAKNEKLIKDSIAVPGRVLLPRLELSAAISPAVASTTKASRIDRGAISRPSGRASYAQDDNNPARMTLANGWTALVGLSGMTGLSSVTLANTISLGDYSGNGLLSNMKFHNWNDYSNYILNNTHFFNKHEAQSILDILNNNLGNNTELEEIQHHFKPLVLQLSAEKPLTERLALESGLGLTYLRSDFENKNLGYLGNRKQKLYYIGVPVGLKYTAITLNSLSLYLSLGGELDIPVYGSQSVASADHIRIGGSVMGAINTSAGIQYGLTSHINAYMEFGLRYNITGDPAFDTYYSAHPLMLSTPVGIRLQF